MKKFLKLSLFLFTVSFMITSCDEEETTFDPLSFPADQYVAFEETEISVGEEVTTPITVTALYVHTDMNASVDVGFTITSDTAVEGEDYYIVDNESSFSFPAGVFSDSIMIVPIDNEVLEDDKVLTITLTDANGDVLLGAPGPDSLGKSVTITLVENDCAREEALRPYEGTYSGTDSCGDYSSEVRLVLPCGTGISIKGLGYPWLEDPSYWAEIVIGEYDALIDIDVDAGTVDIPNQLYVTTDYLGYVSDYFIVGSGTISVSGDDVTLHIEYDMTHPEYGSMAFDYAGSSCPGLFVADVTLDQ